MGAGVGNIRGETCPIFGDGFPHLGNSGKYHGTTPVRGNAVQIRWDPPPADRFQLFANFRRTAAFALWGSCSDQGGTGGRKADSAVHRRTRRAAGTGKSQNFLRYSQPPSDELACCPFSGGCWPPTGSSQSKDEYLSPPCRRIFPASHASEAWKIPADSH